MADYEPLVEYIPRVADWRDLPDTSTPVMAEDIEAWQARLQVLTLKVNEAGARANASASGGQVLSEPAPKGTLYVHDGAGVVKLPPGLYGQHLSPDSNDARGIRWEGGSGSWLTPTLTNAVFGFNSDAALPPLRCRRIADRVDLYGGVTSGGGSATLPPSCRPTTKTRVVAGIGLSTAVVRDITTAGVLGLGPNGGENWFSCSFYVT